MSASSECKTKKSSLIYTFGDRTSSKRWNAENRRGSIIRYNDKDYACTIDRCGYPVFVKHDRISTVRRFIPIKPSPGDLALYVKINRTSRSMLQHECQMTLAANKGKEVAWYVKDGNKERLITLEKKGQDLASCFVRILKTYTYDNFFNLLIEILKKIDNIHQRNICHGDLNFRNIKIDESKKNGGINISIFDYGDSMFFEKELRLVRHFPEGNFSKLSNHQQKHLYANYRKMRFSDVRWPEDRIKAYVSKNETLIRTVLIRRYRVEVMPYVPKERHSESVSASSAYDAYVFLALVILYMRRVTTANKFRGIYEVISEIISLGLDGIGTIKDCINKLQKVSRDVYSDQDMSAYYNRYRSKDQADQDVEKIRKIYNFKKSDVSLSYLESCESSVIFYPRTDLFLFPMRRDNGIYSFAEGLLIFSRIASLVDWIHKKGVVGVVSKQCKIDVRRGVLIFSTLFLEENIPDNISGGESKYSSRADKYIKADLGKLTRLFTENLRKCGDKDSSVSWSCDSLDTKFSNLVAGGNGSLKSILTESYRFFCIDYKQDKKGLANFKTHLMTMGSFASIRQFLIHVFSNLLSVHRDVVGFMPEEKNLTFTKKGRPIFSRFQKPAIFVDTDALIKLRGERKTISAAISLDIKTLLSNIDKDLKALTSAEYRRLGIGIIAPLFKKKFSSVKDVLLELESLPKASIMINLLSALSNRIPISKNTRKQDIMHSFTWQGSEIKQPPGTVKLSLLKQKFKLFLAMIMQRTGYPLSPLATTKSASHCITLLNTQEFSTLRKFLFPHTESKQGVKYQSFYDFTGKGSTHFFQRHAEINLKEISDHLIRLSGTK